MQKKLQIVFRGIDQSDALEDAVRKKVEKLERVNDNLTSCRVVLDSPHNHHHKGKLFQVTLNATSPDGDFTVHDEKEDIYVALRDGFNAMNRQLTALHDKRKSYLRSA